MIKNFNLLQIFLYVAGMLLYMHTVAQPSIQWQKFLGGTGQDEATSIQQTIDGGYIVAGFSDSKNGDVTDNHGGYDYWIVKLDRNGKLLWQKSVGGTGRDEAAFIQQTLDEGFIVGGYSNSNDGDVTGNHGFDDYLIVKLDSSGNLQWQKSFGGSGVDRATSIQQTIDEGYIVGGYSNSNDGDVTGYHGYSGSDYWVVKLDKNGDLQWQKALGGTDNDRAYSIQQTLDKGYIVAGYSSSNDGDVTGNHNSSDCWIVKLDDEGNLQWQKSLGGTSVERALFIRQTIDRGYIMAGFSRSIDGDVMDNRGENNYWIVKLDDSGSLIWQKSYGGTGTDWAFSVQQTTDGGYIVVGDSESNDEDVTGNHGGFDYWIIKLDINGDMQWQKSLGGTGSEYANSLWLNTDGSFIIAGSSSSTDGDVTGNHSIPDHGGTPDYWIAMLDSKVTNSGDIDFRQKIVAYPNPVSHWLTIDLSGLELNSTEIIINLFDMQGRKIFEKSITNIVSKFNIEGLSKGVYFLKVENKDNCFENKLIIK